MENGELPDLEAWQKYREYTVNEMEHVYGRLGVKFDAFEWVSTFKMFIEMWCRKKINCLNNRNLVEEKTADTQLFLD